VAEDGVTRIVRQWARARPDLDPSPILIIGRIARIDQKIDAALRPPFAAANLGNGDFDVLAALRRSDEPHALRPVELSRTLLVTTGAITKRIDRLEEQGYVVRDPSGTDDGRGTLVRLNRRGKVLVDRLIAVHLANERQLLGALTSAEQRTLADLLAKLDAGLISDP
jgi:DNA-binding MarR family transcriptional regulator